MSLSMSAGVTYDVPDSHCMFDIVGLGGISASGLNTLSNERVRSSPWPQTLSTAISEGPVQPTISPVGVMIASENLRTSRVLEIFLELISLRPGMEKAFTQPSLKSPTMM